MLSFGVTDRNIHCCEANKLQTDKLCHSTNLNEMNVCFSVDFFFNPGTTGSISNTTRQVFSYKGRAVMSNQTPTEVVQYSSCHKCAG